MGYLSVEACLALREMGYEEHNLGTNLQRAYYQTNATWAGPFSYHEIAQWAMMHYGAIVFCPDALTALDWLEQEHGWEWTRTKGTPPYMAWHRDSTGPYNRNAGGVDPSSLILAIAAKMQEAV